MGLVYAIHTAPQNSEDLSLPKRPILHTRVLTSGLEDDRNRYRASKHGNTPDRAILLFTVDEILALQNDGWPVHPGHLGENFTLLGIAPQSLYPGRQCEIGNVKVEITEYAKPCKNLKALPYASTQEQLVSFIARLTEKRRGWYAKVLEEGTVRLQDPVRLL